MPDEVDLLSEGDLNLVNEEEAFPTRGPYQCEICQVITDTKFQFVEHIKHFHPDIVDEDVMASLERDLSIQRKKVMLEKQLATTHMTRTPKKEGTKKSDNSRNIPSITTETSKCEICKTQLSKGADLRKHQKTKKCQMFAMEVIKSKEESCHTMCKYCCKDIASNESIDAHYQTEDCLAARFLLDEQEADNAARMICNYNLENTNKDETEVSEISTFHVPAIAYENSQTIHPKYQYDEILALDGMARPKNTTSMDENKITLYKAESSATSHYLDEHNMDMPVASTVADGTTIVCSAIADSTADEGFTYRFGTPVGNSTINSISRGLSMPMIDTMSQFGKDDPSSNGLDVTTNDKASPNMGDDKNLFANLLATGHENFASDGSNHVSDDMTADLLSSIIENTVNSSEHEGIAETGAPILSLETPNGSHNEFSFQSLSMGIFSSIPQTKMREKDENYDTLNTPLMDEMINTPLNDVMINTPLMENEHIIDDPYTMPTHTTATNGKENHSYPAENIK